MSDFNLSDAWDALGNSTVSSLSRRIDNELNSDFLPSPQQATNEAPTIKTGSHETGAAKTAGTGKTDAVSTSWVGGVPNGVVLAVGGTVLLVGLIAAIK